MSDAFAHASAPWVDDGLAEALARLDHMLQRGRSGIELSFDVSGTTPTDTDALELMDGLLARVQTAIQVETRREDRIMVATTITLGGDTQNTIAAAATDDDFLRHGEAIAFELRARTTRLRTLATVFQVATRIAIASGTGNPLLALRAAWRFVSDVLAERAGRA